MLLNWWMHKCMCFGNKWSQILFGSFSKMFVIFIVLTCRIFPLVFNCHYHSYYWFPQIKTFHFNIKNRLYKYTSNSNNFAILSISKDSWIKKYVNIFTNGNKKVRCSVNEWTNGWVDGEMKDTENHFPHASPGDLFKNESWVTSFSYIKMLSVHVNIDQNLKEKKESKGQNGVYHVFSFVGWMEHSRMWGRETLPLLIFCASWTLKYTHVSTKIKHSFYSFKCFKMKKITFFVIVFKENFKK